MTARVVQKLYSTQILLVQNGAKHSNEVYFRRIDQTIDAWVRRQLTPEEREEYARRISFDDFNRRSCFVFRHEGRRLVASQVLVTEKLMCHGLTVRRYVPSSFKEAICDAYIETSLCIEASKIKNDGSVHFSIAVRFVHEPIRGFYPSKIYEPVEPELVNLLLADPITRGEFVQIIQDREDYPVDLPKISYPIDNDYTLSTPEARRNFIAQLTDPLRPICLVVVFGRGWKCNYAVRKLALKLYSKACVYHVEKLTGDLKSAFEKAIPEVNLTENMRERTCRVFFPLGPYMSVDWANPSYRLSLFNVGPVIQYIKKGCFACFDIGKLGWRKDDYDVFETKRRLREERKEESKIAAALEVAEHRETCEKIIFQCKEEIDYLKLANMDYQTEVSRLEDENRSLNQQLSRQNARVASFEAARADVLANSAIKFPENLEMFPGEVRAHVLAAIEKGRQGVSPTKQVRKSKILEEVLKANPKSNILAERRNAVKNLIANSGAPDKALFRALERLGISKVAGNEHFKVEFAGIPVTLAKTPSDWRAAKNSVSTMINSYF